MRQVRRTGIEGAGFNAVVHAPAAGLAGARLVGVAASSPESVRSAAGELGADRAFDSALQLVESERVAVQLRSLEAAATELVQLRAVERIGAVATAAARDGLDGEVLVVALIDDAGRELRAEYVGALPNEAHDRLASTPVVGSGLVARVARSSEPVFLRSPADVWLDRWSAAMARITPSSAMAAALPLAGGELPLGVIVFGRSRRRGFSKHDCAFMKVLAGLCALAVERVRLSSTRSRIREGPGARRFGPGPVVTERTIGGMRIDFAHLQVDVHGRSAQLTPSEFRLLMFLAEQPGRPRTRHEILQRLWETDHIGSVRACDAHIWNLRRKIERDPSSPLVVLRRGGVGYALQAP
jgi:hypothetical protein